MGLEFYEIPRDTKKTYRGTATLIELVHKQEQAYITLSFDVPTRDEETFKTYPVQFRNNTDVLDRKLLERTARIQASIEGYKLAVPDDFLWED